MIKNFLPKIFNSAQKQNNDKSRNTSEYSTAQKSTMFDELAKREDAYNYFSFLNQLPNPDPILRKSGQNIAVYRELLYDPHVWACVQSRKSGVTSLEWSIDRNKAKSRQAKIIEDIFKDLDVYKIINEVLNAPLYGFQPMEIYWKQVGNLIVPYDVKAKPPDWFFFDKDENLRFREKSNPAGRLILNEEKKFLIPGYDTSYSNPYGESILSRCFWYVAFKKGGFKWWVVFTEKYGMPFIIGKHDRGTAKEEIDDLAETLEAMIQDAIAVIPNDASIEIKEAGKGSSVAVYEKLLEKCDNYISKAILGQTLTTEVGNKGSYAASKTHFDVRQDIIDSDKRLVTSTINHLIRWIDAINFNSGNPPEFSLWKEEDVDKDLAERDEILSNTGVKFTKTYFIKNYGLEDDDFEIISPSPETAQQPATTQFSEFSNNKNQSTEDQQKIDEFGRSFSDEDLQNYAEILLKPVLKVIEECSDFNEAMERISGLYPKMESDKLEELLTKANFISETWGRANAG